MYEEFYGLKEKPFSLTPDPRFFFLSENHRVAFQHLLYGIKEREGFVLITGEVGAGKTTLCRVLINKLESSTTDCALILNPMFSGEELIRSIVSDFGIQSQAKTKKELVDDLNRFLLNQQAAGRHSILIIDEAQNLPLPVLEEIRILSNLETEKEKLLQIVLMGQIELKEKLSLAQLRQLNQRISIRYHLQTLEKDEVSRYIQHRLTVAGSSGGIHFSAGALKEIYHYSQGIPRLINLAADRALLAGYVQQTLTIKRETVVKGVQSLEGEVMSLSLGFWQRALRQGVAALLIFFLGIFVATLYLDPDKAWVKKSTGDSRPAPVEARARQRESQEHSFYTIQLGSYKTEAEAVEVAETVKTTGYPLFMAKADGLDGVGRHRLYLGKFSQREEAEEIERTFKKVEGFSEAQVVLTAGQRSKKDQP